MPPVASVDRAQVRAYRAEELLGELTDAERKFAPSALYLSGDASLLTNYQKVALVGSRNASAGGLRRAGVLSRALAQRGIVVVSGLAKGIDTAAHRAAIAAGGHTIAVLGTPLDQCYPASNTELFETIKAQHLAVSQFPLGTPVTRGNFPRRNRTMALLSDATVIVEASESSGSLSQGWEAIRLGRMVFLMEALTTDASLTWPAKMIEYGAQILSRDNLEPIIENLPAFTQASTAAVAF
jgi:DNA processing protein